LTDPGFADDDGGADAALLALLADVRDGARDRFDAYRALADARLLVPVVAVAGEEPAVAPARPSSARATLSRPSDKNADMAVMTLVSADGAKALPVFTSLAAMAAWDERARPVPVTGRRACEAAVFENAEALVVDVASATRLTVAGSALRALATGRLPMRAVEDAELRTALGRAIGGVQGIGEVIAQAGLIEAEGRSLLGLVPTPEAPAAAEMTERQPAARIGEVARLIAAAVAADPLARERLDGGLGIAVLPPGTTIPAARRLDIGQPTV
jgi:hypothetical protein